MEQVKLGQLVKTIIEAINNNFAEVQNNYALKSELSKLFKNVDFNNKTGTFTFTFVDGTSKQIDTNLEKVVMNFSYDSATKELVLTLDDGSEMRIPMTAFIDDYTGGTTPSGTITVTQDNVISFALATGAVDWANLSASAQKRVTDLEAQAHSHGNKSVLDATTASFTTALKNKLDSLQNYTLPVGGNNLGGVKNGGNVVIGTDGKMNVAIPSGTVKIDFTSAETWTSEGGYFYLSKATNGKTPLAVYRTEASVTEQTLCSVAYDGTNVKIGSLDKFTGYVICA